MCSHSNALTVSSPVRIKSNDVNGVAGRLPPIEKANRVQHTVKNLNEFSNKIEEMGSTSISKDCASLPSVSKPSKSTPVALSISSKEAERNELKSLATSSLKPNEEEMKPKQNNTVKGAPSSGKRSTSSSKSIITFKQFRVEVEKWNKTKKISTLQEFYRSGFDNFKILNDIFKKPRSSKSAQPSSLGPDPNIQQKYVGAVYENLMTMNQEIQKLVLKGIINCLLNEWKGIRREGDLRAYFILIQNPMFSQVDTYVAYAHLLRQLATLNEGDQTTLIHWFRKLSTSRFRPLIERLHQFVTCRLFPGQSTTLPPMSNCGWWIPSAVKVLSILNKANNLVMPRHVSFREFYNSALDHIDVRAEYKQWENPAHTGFNFCQFPFIWSLIAKRKILRQDQERQMVRCARSELVASIQRRPTRAPSVNQLFLNITVRRQHLLQDSLEQIYGNRTQLKKKLRVEFVGEPGYDMGGLTKEWFILLLRKVLSPDYNTFTYNKTSHSYWFAESTAENSSDLFLVGVLMGLAVYNCITLDIRLPMVCYRKLLSCSPGNSKTTSTPVGVVPVTLEDYRNVDPEMTHGLEELLKYEGDVEEDMDLTFDLKQDDFGVTRCIPLKSGGDKIPVTNANRKEYVQAVINYKLNKGVYRQFLAFYHGFYTVCCSNALTFLCPEELETLVCGNSGFDLKNLKKYTSYQGYANNDPTILYFWDTLLALTRDLQKRFLHFCTGSDRVPVGGMQELNFKIIKAPVPQNMLPMAHTCFNQLMLPPYGSRQQLESKLVIAISNAEGFGLE